jgi:multidrug resistance efflux pump
VVALVVLTGIALVVISDDGDDGALSGFRDAIGLDSDDASVEGSGYIEGTRVTVSSALGGRVDRVLVRTGDEVGQGDVLVQLEDRTLDARLRQAEAQLESAKAGRDQLNAGAGTDLIRGLETAVAQAQLALKGAERDLDDAIEADQPSAVVDARRTGREVALAALRLAEAELALAQAGPADHYELAAEAAVRQADAVRRGLELQLEQLTVRSPITGTVTQVSVKPGETVAQGAAVAHVAQLDPLQLVIYVPEENLSDIEPGQKVTIDVDSFDDSFRGEVVAIRDEAEYTPRNVQTKDDRRNLVYAVFIRVPNDDNDLKLGMPADASIEVD